MQSKQIHISKKLEENKKLLEEKLGIGISFDIIYREMRFAGRDFAIIYLNGFAKDNITTIILKELAALKREDLAPSPIEHLVETFIPHIQVETVDTLDQLVGKLLTGQVAIMVDQTEKTIIVDAKEYPSRTPQEPDTERVVRGSRDGFTETILTNTVLTRRRIRDPQLRMEMMQVGRRSKTHICIGYLKDVADPGLVETIRKKLKQIQVDGLPMAEKSVEEFIVGKNWHPFPLVRYTERPDVAATHILEGHVIIYVDTSPSVMIAPTTYFHHVQHAEEYRQNPMIGGYLRWTRFLGILASLFLLPIWLLYVLEPELLTKSFEFIGPKKTGEIPIVLQFFFAEVGLDLMRMAAIHTPSPLATAMGLIAAVLIGDIAIKVGLFIPEVILYLSIAAVGMFATPSYELSLANKLIRITLIFAVAIFKLPGLMIGITLWIILLATTKSLTTPYLWPFIPFNFKAMKAILVRQPVPEVNKRPSIVHPIDSTRRPQ